MLTTPGTTFLSMAGRGLLANGIISAMTGIGSRPAASSIESANARKWKDILFFMVTP
jgi:hypothetical protein